jgi:hypothetical protein
LADSMGQDVSGADKVSSRFSAHCGPAPPPPHGASNQTSSCPAGNAPGGGAAACAHFPWDHPAADCQEGDGASPPARRDLPRRIAAGPTGTGLFCQKLGSTPCCALEAARNP